MKTGDERFAYEGPDELRGVFTEALESVVDPEVALNIVDVGLIYGVRVENGAADVTMTMTSAACPVADVILEDIDFALDQALPPGMQVRVALVWEPPWTPERISPAARKAMGW